MCHGILYTARAGHPKPSDRGRAKGEEGDEAERVSYTRLIIYSCFTVNDQGK